MRSRVILTGKISAALCVLSILIWFIAFGIIANSGPLFKWSDMEAYMQYISDNNQFWAYLAKGFILIFSLSFLTMHISLVEIQPDERKFPGKIGLIFMSMFALLSSVHYFIQMSSVRLSLKHGVVDGLEHFLQANPVSFSLAVNMLGWTVMLGIASVFMGISLQKTGRNRWLRILYFSNAAFCLIALIGFLIPLDVLTFPAINLGVGGCITGISVLTWIVLQDQATLVRN